jgi:gliding motility-associated-like protein
MQPAKWSTRGAVRIIQQTDSSLTVKFDSFGANSIQALLPYSCSPIMDSLEVAAFSKTPPLNLGPDTSICVNNTLLLKAGPKFYSYQWQDGSTDSILTVSTPGQYWVKVTDSCDNVLSDTITITTSASISFNVGPDRIKCNDDTIQLSAPPGFLQYTWSPAYNISALNKQQVIVNPKLDTTYFVQAEKSPGCFAYDTIRVKVNLSPAIQLGQDISFCQGDSRVLDAGNGFANYQWSIGNSSQQISVKTAGTFSVIGTTGDGCKSYDTLQVIKVFANPTVQLDGTSFLCTGATRTLDAGSYASYAWSDGSTNRTLRINATGIYTVTVTDNNQCNGSDTVTIVTLRPSPQAFLPADTLICTYGKLQLKPLSDFKNYLWSTNELTPFITISKAGKYSLQVTDQYGCVGKDSMVVSPRDCLYGFYIPNVFTPNNDGKNDVFKPMLFGRIIKFHFAIFNRWGQKVFETTDINKGWMGDYTGTQNTTQFVWTCTYQLEGEAVKSEKGTVILLR